MTGTLIVYTATPDAAVVLTHDSGQTFTTAAVNGVATLGPFDLPNGNGARLVVDGVSYRGVLWLDKLNPVNHSASFAVDTYPPFRHGLPVIPTREQACGVRMHFQGAEFTSDAYGTLPLFEVVLTSPGITGVDRERIYAAVAGDTHYNVSISWAYTEPGQAYQHIPGCDLTGDLPTLRAFLTEIIQHGFLPLVALAGDGHSNAAGDYNDPAGLTYGHEWLMVNLPRLLATLKSPPDLTPYCLFTPGYDGVFYGWSPVEVTAFGKLFRSLCPDGYLALEHGIGHLPLGGGPGDYGSSGALADYDVILSEFDYPVTGAGIWQIAARVLGPAYRRPPDQPAGDDPHPPFYLANQTARGPYYACAYERGLYNQVRHQATPAEIEGSRQYLRDLGYQWWG